MCHFFPGAILIIIGGALLDVVPTVALVLSTAGFLLLIAWPAFAITVHLRHERKLKRREKQLDTEQGSDPSAQHQFGKPVLSDPLHAFVDRAETLILMFGLPGAVLGGLGVYCLVTAADDPGQEGIKIFAGIGSLALLGGYLLLLVLGRTPLTLRIIGGAVAVFGVAGIVAVASVIGRAGISSVSDVIMAIASLVMIAAGTWLAITGRNTFRSKD